MLPLSSHKSQCLTYLMFILEMIWPRSLRPTRFSIRPSRFGIKKAEFLYIHICFNHIENISTLIDCNTWVKIGCTGECSFSQKLLKKSMSDKYFKDNFEINWVSNVFFSKLFCRLCLFLVDLGNYTCEFCQKGFLFPSQLDAHIKGVHQCMLIFPI